MKHYSQKNSLRSRPAPLSTYAADFLVYYFTCVQNVAQAENIARLVSHMGLRSDRDVKEQPFFAKRILSCQEGFPLLLLRTISLWLRDNRTLNAFAVDLISLWACFLEYGGWLISESDTVDKSFFIPSLMLACRRQICSSNSGEAHIFVITALERL